MLSQNLTDANLSSHVGKKPRDSFGMKPPNGFNKKLIDAWRKRLPP
jgi:hypothetical protein